MGFWDGVKAFGEATKEMFSAKESTVRGFSDAAQSLLSTVNQTAQRTYIGSGFMDEYRSKPNVRNVVSQNPELIVVVKKKMFSSLQENYPIVQMDMDEKHFIRASKKLFANKCKELAAYEALTKVEKVVRQNGVLNTGSAAFILDLIDSVEMLFLTGSNLASLSSAQGIIPPTSISSTNSILAQGALSDFSKIIERLRQVLAYNSYSTTTNWITSGKHSSLFDPSGEGSGSIEFSVVTDFSCSTGITLGSGNARFTILDPCRICFMESADIERAIYETSFNGFSITNYLSEQLQEQADRLRTELNQIRQGRGASPISIKVNPQAKFSNKVSIILDKYGAELTQKDGNGINTEALRDDGIFGTLLLGIAAQAHTFELKHNVKELLNIERFDRSEEQMLSEIYDATFNVLSMQILDMKNYYDYNDKTNFVREEMRKAFMGKEIIQPMDTVHAFIGSQAADDNELLSSIRQSFSVFDDITNKINGTSFGSIFKTGGLQKFLGSNDGLSSMNQLMGDFTDTWSALFGKKGASPIEVERDILAGPDFPLYLYMSLRNYFNSNEFGCCVFSGIVENAIEQFADASYRVNVSCKDNSYFFEQGFTATNPALMQFNGYLYDPLTAFNEQYDPVSGQLMLDSSSLLYENSQLITSGLLRYVDGVKYRGGNVTPDNYYRTEIREIPGLASNNSQYNSSDPTLKATALTTLAQRIYYRPEGFVYRWKHGIATAWQNQSYQKVHEYYNDPRRQNEIANIIQTDAFAGQDLVNCISILVCGEPYNLVTFTQAALQNGQVSTDSNRNTSDLYFNDITKLIKSQNKIWGNFMPFKRFALDNTSFGQLFSAQLTVLSQSARIKQLQTDRAHLMDQLLQIDYNLANQLGDLVAPKYNSSLSLEANVANQQKRVIWSNSAVKTQGIISRIIKLDSEIETAQQLLSQSLETSPQIKNQLSVFGTTGVTFSNYAVIKNSPSSATTKTQAASLQEKLLRQQKALTQRRLWQVKANIDRNLFIVCDEYDYDYDLQAVGLTFGNISMFDSKWNTIKEKISTIAQIMGMELFVNTQGHIEFRVPQYNRMPTSVFYDMIRRKREYGVRVYPEFLEKSLTKRAESLFDDLEVIVDQIRLYTTMLGNLNDTDREKYLEGSIGQNDNATKFQFLTDRNGKLTNLRSAVKMINNDYVVAETKSDSIFSAEDTFIVENTNMGDFFQRNSDAQNVSNRLVGYSPKSLEGVSVTEIVEETKKLKDISQNTHNNFDIVKQRQLFEQISDTFYGEGGIKSVSLLQKLKGEYDAIKARLEAKLCTKLASIETYFQSSSQTRGQFISPIDIDSINRNLDNLVSLRYKEIMTLTNTISNLDNAAKANSSDVDIMRGLMLPNMFPSKDIPDYMKNMLEDETEDDLGIDAGKRYVLREKDIISSTYGEYNPDFTSIDVSGSEGAQGILSSSGQGFKAGEIEMAKVWGVDYDLWRHYGYKNVTGKYLPFLNNPETQLAPFAVFLLNQQKGKVLQASITTRGNEYYQPGEVYFLEERGMLFYVESVSHNFKYGGSFNSSLKLTYGHCPGQYIPTLLDAIGKLLYRSYQSSTNLNVMVKNTNEIKDSPLGAFIFDSKQITRGKEVVDALFAGPYGDKNKETLSNILYKSQTLINSPIAGIDKTKQAVVSVRIYKYNKAFSKADTNGKYIKQAAEQIISKLVMPEQNKDNLSTEQLQALASFGLHYNKIVGGTDPETFTTGVAREVELSATTDKSERRIASAQAFEIAKDFAGSSGVLSTYDQKNLQQISSEIKDSLSANVIDVWIEFITPTADTLAAVTSSTALGQTQLLKPNVQDLSNFYEQVLPKIEVQTDIVERTSGEDPLVNTTSTE